MFEVVVGCAIAVLTGCSTETKRPPEKDSSGSLLDPAARRELEALRVGKYAGEAVAGDMTTTDVGALRVSFDVASGPICLDGDPYAAFYMDRGSEDLAIFLDGGGACWTDFCNATHVAANDIYRTTANVVLPNPEKPDRVDFSDWNVVSVPYCDGSVFMGDAEVALEGGQTRYHHGRQNLAAALDLAVEHFPDPKRILLGGFSAGGYGTITAVLAVRLRYPDVKISVLDDAGPGLFNPEEAKATEQRRDEWKYEDVLPASCTGCLGADGQLWPLIDWALTRDRGLRFSVASYFHDNTIPVFLNVKADRYETLLRSAMRSLQDAQPSRFHPYLLPGENHVVSDDWDIITADGQRFDEWVVAMIDGDAAWKEVEAAGP